MTNPARKLARKILEVMSDLRGTTKIRNAVAYAYSFLPARLRWKLSQSMGGSGSEADSPELREQFKQFVGRCGKLLDVGCGKRSSYAADFIMGIDPIFSVSYPQTFVLGVGENMPFQDKEFDVAVCFTSLDHCFDPKAVVSEMCRVARRVCIGMTVTRVRDFIHTSRLSKEEFLSLVLDNQFRIETIPLNKWSEFCMAEART